MEKHKLREVNKLLKKLKLSVSENPSQSLELFVKIARVIYPKAENVQTISLLKSTLGPEKYINAYSPAQENEIQLMTIHKSKGLEFDIVFHLDLYEYIFPKKYDGKYSDYKQDLNSHYVALTRAKTCNILCSSTIRTDSKGFEIKANRSEFLTLPYLKQLRLESEF